MSGPSLKRIRTACIAAAKITLKRRGRQITFLPQSLGDVKPLKLLAVIRTHASHGFVELADNGQHLLWYAEACEHHPQQLSVDGVICSLEIDEAREQRDSPSLSEFLQSAQTNSISTVDRAGQKPHCSSGSIPSVSQ